MCLYPRIIRNRKYGRTKKNGGNIPKCNDERVKKVAIGCGNCYECRKQKAQEWKVRLQEELKEQREDKPYFVTLTFSPDGLNELCKKFHVSECNAAATIAVRHFCELWRKYEKKAPRHWLITELGHEGTERIHMHGLIWTSDANKIKRYWRYGNIWVGEYCNAKTINYIIKYVTKIDIDHRNYKSIILCSRGIGGRYLEKENAKMHQYRPGRTREYYRLENGGKVNLPIYYRNRLWTDDEREALWIEKLDSQVTYVLGIKYALDTDEHINQYINVIQEAQKWNKRIGYGDLSHEWKKNAYSITIRMLNKAKKC